MTLRLAWASDIHLDCCDNATAREFAEECADRSDALVITGDITNGRETTLFTTFAARYSKPVYFVLGNHDYWHRSFASVEAEYKEIVLCAHNATFLDWGGVFSIAPGVELCGVSGWYDAREGNQDSPFALQDWWLIDDLIPLRVPFELGDGLRKEFRKRADASARVAARKLNNSTAGHVFFATHVPPFAGAAWHLGRRSEDDALPYFSNKALGLALNRWAAANPSRGLTTLCGHSHSRGDYQAAANHIVRTAAADYGRPSIEHVFELGDT
jgi:3',5'-cyclic-AMP phosphodiesterase